MNNGINVRAQFRLNGMDLQAGSAVQEHWLMREPVLRAWLADLEKAFDRLVDAGFQPFGADPVTPEAVIDALGFWDDPQPTGLLAHAAFTARMLRAATRESLRVERELAWLGRHNAKAA